MLKSWDIFDTLIARRCVFPQNIFAIVEKLSNVQGFVSARMVAEQNLFSRGNFTFDDIYEEFQRITSAPKNLCDALKKLELDVEFEQSIPITENIRQVKSGDILISDMYLPEQFVRRLLKKAGLLVPVEIVITSSGKHSGRVWKQLVDQKKFVFHVGDNLDSDIKKTRLAGFEAFLSVLSNPNPPEQYMLQKDFNFGAYLREIRLRNPFSEEIKRIYWQLCTANMGLLILLVQQIDILQKKCGFEYLGFCGRDTYYLRLLYEKYKLQIGETPVPNDYLYYSRKLVHNSGAELAKYFSAKINGRKALLIDLFGSGTHLHTLRKAFKLNFSILICLLGRDVFNLYPNMPHVKNWLSAFDSTLNVSTDDAAIFFFDVSVTNLDGSVTELLNRAVHNTPVRLRTIHVGDKLLPEVTFSEINDTENFDVLTACLDEVLNSKLIFPASNSDGGGVKELISPLIHFVCSSHAPLPLRANHNISGQIDATEFKISTEFAQKK